MKARRRLFTLIAPLVFPAARDGTNVAARLEALLNVVENATRSALSYAIRLFLLCEISRALLVVTLSARLTTRCAPFIRALNMKAYVECLCDGLSPNVGAVGSPLELLVVNALLTTRIYRRRIDDSPHVCAVAPRFAATLGCFALFDLSESVRSAKRYCVGVAERVLPALWPIVAAVFRPFQAAPLLFELGKAANDARLAALLALALIGARQHALAKIVLAAVEPKAEFEIELKDELKGEDTLDVQTAIEAKNESEKETEANRKFKAELEVMFLCRRLSAALAPPFEAVTETRNALLFWDKFGEKVGCFRESAAVEHASAIFEALRFGERRMANCGETLRRCIQLCESERSVLVWKRIYVISLANLHLNSPQNSLSVLFAHKSHNAIHPNIRVAAALTLISLRSAEECLALIGAPNSPFAAAIRLFALLELAWQREALTDGESAAVGEREAAAAFADFNAALARLAKADSPPPLSAVALGEEYGCALLLACEAAAEHSLWTHFDAAFALHDEPSRSTAARHYLSARRLRARGRAEDARRAVAASLAADPLCEGALCLAAQLNLDAPDADCAAAIADVQLALSVRESTRGRWLLSQLCSREGDEESARRHSLRAFELLFKALPFSLTLIV